MVIVKRVLILGAPGTGKNWLAEQLSKISGITYYDTDDIAWRKKYTSKRSHQEKCDLMNNISKKDKWIVCSGARSYLGYTPKRALIIIILKDNLLRTTFRILKRFIIRRFKGEPGNMKSTIENIKNGYFQYHKPSGKIFQYYQELEKKYPEKILILSERDKHQFLKKYN